MKDLLVAGGEDKNIRAKYDVPATMAEFVALAATDGYAFTEEELAAVLKESGDVFEKKRPPGQTPDLVSVGGPSRH